MLNKTAIAAATVMCLWASSAMATIFDVNVWTGPNNGINSKLQAELPPCRPSLLMRTSRSRRSGNSINLFGSHGTDGQFFTPEGLFPIFHPRTEHT